MCKKLISVLLSIVLLCALLPQLAPQASAAAMSGTCGENLRWSFDETTGVLTITGSGAMDDYSYETKIPWISLRYRITGIRLPEGLTNIGEMAFSNCARFTELTIPGSVTRIGKHAFTSAQALTKLTLPDGLREIGEYAFFDCVSLKDVTIPDGVESIEAAAFSQCGSLEQILLPASLTRLDNAVFSYCAKLREIRVDPANPAFCSEDGVLFSKDKAELIQYPCAKAGAYRVPEQATFLQDAAFAECSGLTEITIPEGSPIADAPDLQYWFDSCSALERIRIPQSSTRYESVDGVLYNEDKTEILLYPRGRAGAYQIPKGVTHVGDNAFSECDGLTDVTIPEGVTGVGVGAFYGCEKLKTVSFPESLTYIDNWSFMGCESLEEVSLQAKVGWIGEAAFSGCGSVKAYKVHPDNPHLCSEDGVLFLKDKSQLLHYPGARAGSYKIPDSVIVINYSAFTGCSGLEALEFPASIDNVNGLELSTCSRLTALHVDPENRVLCSVDGVVFNKDKTKLLRFPTGRTGEYRIPDGVKTIGDDAFESCSVSKITIPDGVTRVENCALAYNNNLKSVTFPASVSSISAGMFMLDDNLERVTVLNPECWIDQSIYSAPESYGNPSLTVYCGYRGSTAQDVAERYGFRFEEIPSKTGFADVADAAGVADAVAWAVARSVTNGTTPYYFRPDATCTRAQAATFLWRAYGKTEPANAESDFADVAAAPYYSKAVAWAVEQGIARGVDSEHFAPNSACTRGQVVTFLWRAAGKPEPAGGQPPFTDVSSDAYYAKAVAWAVEKGITKGTSAGKFSPDSPCTRGQIVTFLYRGLAA